MKANRTSKLLRKLNVSLDTMREVSNIPELSLDDKVVIMSKDRLDESLVENIQESYSIEELLELRESISQIILEKIGAIESMLSPQFNLDFDEIGEPIGDE